MVHGITNLPTHKRPLQLLCQRSSFFHISNSIQHDKACMQSQHVILWAQTSPKSMVTTYKGVGILKYIVGLITISSSIRSTHHYFILSNVDDIVAPAKHTPFITTILDHMNKSFLMKDLYQHTIFLA